MNLNSISANFMTPATNFGCSDPNCKCQAGIVSTNEPQKDTLAITKDVAAKLRCKTNSASLIFEVSIFAIFLI